MNDAHDRLSVRLPKDGRRRQTLTASPGDSRATHGDSQTHTRKEPTVTDHAWLDHIIHTGELPEHFGNRANLRREIQAAAREVEAIASSSSFRADSPASAPTPGDGAEALSTRRPHAAESRGSEAQDFLPEEEGTGAETRAQPRIAPPSEAVLAARREAIRADRERQTAMRHAGPVLAILEEHLPIVAASVRTYLHAVRGEAKAYRQYARALAADLAALERE